MVELCRIISLSALLLVVSPTTVVAAFRTPIHCQKELQPCRRSSRSSGALSSNSDNNENNAVAPSEAEKLLARAKAIRESLPPEETPSPNSAAAAPPVDRILSDFQLQSQTALDNSYRLYLDIGREPGTWMDPRWGASGRRIECTLDVSFARRPASEDGGAPPPASASGEIESGLIRTATSRSSSLSPALRLQCAPCARLRGGFDKMAIRDGGYCLESPASGPSVSASSTLRFCLEVSGTAAGKIDGDVSIPEGNLYFALAFFGSLGNLDSNGKPQMNLSNKEGTITVKQMGWHTGWRREESRILGVFRAVPLEKARARDKF